MFFFVIRIYTRLVTSLSRRLPKFCHGLYWSVCVQLIILNQSVTRLQIKVLMGKHSNRDYFIYI